MERRQFCQNLFLGLGLVTSGRALAGDEDELHAPASKTSGQPLSPPVDREQVQRMQYKIDNYNEDFVDDVYLSKERMPVFKSVLAKISKVQSAIGYGRFNLLSFDAMLKVAADVKFKIGAFSAEELGFVEEIFFTDAKNYGFYGEKVTDKLTTHIREKDTIKIAGSGHYLFRGRPEALYREITKDVGSDIILTSGIRSVVKQLHLFLMKTEATNGNLSRASRSLAPPGHSFHGISDFDVGKTGWGYRNFSDQFAESDVFKRLTDLGYVDIRYTRTNAFGVRFEPWHIKV